MKKSVLVLTIYLQTQSNSSCLKISKVFKFFRTFQNYSWKVGKGARRLFPSLLRCAAYFLQQTNVTLRGFEIYVNQKNVPLIIVSVDLGLFLLTHFMPLIPFYTPGKHVFTGYRKKPGP